MSAARLLLLGMTVGLAACRAESVATSGKEALENISRDDLDADGSPSGEDCDDQDASTFPGAEEVCDGVDNNCDGVVDEGVMLTWYADADADGFGDAEAAFAACAPPMGTVANADDCDDADATIWPGAPETCNGVDDDCDVEVDEDVGAVWYADSDGDGFGDLDAAVFGCEAPEGAVANASDCQDDDATIFPGATEVCNERDDNCDGNVDEGVQETFWIDLDADGWGSLGATVEACVVPAGYAVVAGDCEDADPARNPGATEVCNALDDDCDGAVDEPDAVDVSLYYADADADGFGDPSTSVMACAAPSGHVADATDCNDAEAAVFPGANEVCNAIDDNCDGLIDDADPLVDLSTATTWYADADTDGFGDSTTARLSCAAGSGEVALGTDCNDSVAAIYPGANEVCNGVDDDCDSLIDDNDPGLDISTTVSYYTDGDRDGYGDAATARQACDATATEVALSGDCDDASAAVNPGAREVCNGIDDDCDLAIDDDDTSLDTSTGSAWYPDTDGDGFGDASGAIWTCVEPSGVTTDDSDCDDTDADAFPGALERLDGDDEDCDGVVDEAVVAMVFAFQCVDNVGHPSLTPAQATQAESDQIEAYLDDMDLGMDRYDEVVWGGSGAALEAYDLVLYSDCGWSWQASNQPLVDELLDMRDLGIPTFLFGDDLGWTCGNVVDEEALTLVQGCYSNGAASTFTMSGVAHDAYVGPYGTPASFAYAQDMDHVAAWTGTTVLATNSAYGTSSPVWSVYEDTGNGSRAVALETSIFMTNHAQVSAAAETELEIIFKNSVSWLLGL